MAMLQATRPPLPARPVSLADVAAIIALDDKPALRNLRITECYGELSQAIATVLGAENANWCTFATWASKTAGRFIRMVNLQEAVRFALRKSSARSAWLRGVQERLARAGIAADFDEDVFVLAAQEIAGGVSADVAAGNLTVFSELAPTFVTMIAALQEARTGPAAALEALLASLKPGPTSRGGQDLLRRAVSDYHAALVETDRRRKAELMLRANGQVGAHEQIRLQPYIARAMSAPLGDAVAALVHRRRRRGGESDRRGLHAYLDLILHPYLNAVQQVWLEVATEYLMTLEVPNGTLHLGRDLPRTSGQPDFPPDLGSPQDPDLLRILSIYDADGPTTTGSEARDWANLSDRLHYILLLFRSRQQDRFLFEPPFPADASRLIARGEIPLAGI